MKPKIAFFRIWPSPPIATSVADLLKTSFPEFEVEIFDFISLLKDEKTVLLQNALSVLWHYGWGILTGKWDFRTMFWRTPSIFRWMKSRAEGILAASDFCFSFQLGSLYDASLSGIPHCVYTDHTHLENLNYAAFDPTQLAAPAWNALEKTVYAHATKIFTRSSNISRSLREQYDCPADKIAQVYMGSNVQVVQAPLENDNYGNQNILFVGGDWERKGGPDLVAAFEKVLQTFPGAQLTIVGCRPDVKTPNVKIVGPVPVDATHPYFLQASVFCLPTKLEPFGAVFVEALAYRLPIVATAIGAIPDFVLPGENGILVQPGEIAELAAALSQLLGNPKQCQDYGEQSYQLAQKKYNWETVGQRIRAELEPILGL